MTEPTIHGNGIRLVKLEEVGTRTSVPFDGEWVTTPESDPIDFTGGKVTTQGLQWLNLTITFCELNPLWLALVTGRGRLVFGYPPPLPVNGREYRRRVRRR